MIAQRTYSIRERAQHFAHRRTNNTNLRSKTRHVPAYGFFLNKEQVGYDLEHTEPEFKISDRGVLPP